MNNEDISNKTDSNDHSTVIATDLVKDYYMEKLANRVLNGISFQVQRGDFVAIMGPSGSGKSTLLYLLGGLTHPTSGSVVIEGIEITSLQDRKLTKIRQDKIGFIFQRFNLLPTLSTLDNVEIPLKIGAGIRMNGSKDQMSPVELLDLVGLGSKLKHRPSELSIGEQQRVAIARALVRDPDILLADEPTGSLDSKNSMNVLELLCKLNEEHHQTIIMVTHDEKVASRAARILRMEDGLFLS